MASFARTKENGHTYRYTWPNLNSGDLTGDGAKVVGLVEKSVQVKGNFGATSTVTIEGSNVASPSVDADWTPLHDPFNNVLIFTTSDIQIILEHSVHIRPVVALADGSTDIDVLVIGKGA